MIGSYQTMKTIRIQHQHLDHALATRRKGHCKFTSSSCRKQKRLDKFIDFEQELYEENDFSPLKANRSRLDSEGSDEWKDKVEALPGKANKKKRGFVSNISKKKIKDKGVKKEHSNLSDDREERFGLRRQQTYENGNFSNAITQNRISDLMQTAKFKLNSEQSTNIR